MLQDSVPAPKATSGAGFGIGYTTYLHSGAWVLRKAVAAMTGDGNLFDKTLSVETPDLGEGHVKVSVCIPRDAAMLSGAVTPLPLVLVAEGGGFVLGQPSDGEHILRTLSDKINAVFVSVDYAKAPRYPFPHALLQMYHVILAATTSFSESLDVAIDPARVAIMGNSAGGNLSASLTLMLSFTTGPCARFRESLPEPFRLVGQLLIYPSVACNRPYLDRYNEAEDNVRAASLPVWIFIAPVDVDVGLLRSLKLPPALIITAGKDCLKIEAEAYKSKLGQAGVNVTSHEYPEVIHGFSHHKRDYSEEREHCWGLVEQFLKQQFAT